jgi:hypothetical protein
MGTMDRCITQVNYSSIKRGTKHRCTNARCSAPVCCGTILFIIGTFNSDKKYFQHGYNMCKKIKKNMNKIKYPK